MVAKVKAAGYEGLGVGAPALRPRPTWTRCCHAVSPQQYDAYLTNFAPGSPTDVR